MQPQKVLGHKTHDEIEQRLIHRLYELDKSLRSHECETSSRLPSRSDEAAPLKNEMNIVESEEKVEVDEIRLIEDALERLKEGRYGICELCHKAIPAERLTAIPESRYCLPCQRNYENKANEEDWLY